MEQSLRLLKQFLAPPPLPYPPQHTHTQTHKHAHTHPLLLCPPEQGGRALLGGWGATMTVVKSKSWKSENPSWCPVVLWRAEESWGSSCLSASYRSGKWDLGLEILIAPGTLWGKRKQQPSQPPATRDGSCDEPGPSQGRVVDCSPLACEAVQISKPDSILIWPCVLCDLQMILWSRNFCASNSWGNVNVLLAPAH